MGSFISSAQDLKGFMPQMTMYEQQGVSFAYSAPPEVLRRIVPDELEILAPIVSGYVGMIKGSSYSGPFTESGLSVLARVKETGDVGNYNISFMVHGPGSFNATAIGRDYIGTAKKYADHIECWRAGATAGARVVRKGVTLIDITMDVDGDYNSYAAEQVLGKDPAGTVRGSNLYFRFCVESNADGSVGFSNGRIIKLDRETDIMRAEKGKLRSISLGHSENDPYSELAVVKPLGALFYHYRETRVTRVAKVAGFNLEETTPKLLTARYDRGVFGDAEARLSF